MKIMTMGATQQEYSTQAGDFYGAPTTPAAPAQHATFWDVFNKVTGILMPQDTAASTSKEPYKVSPSPIPYGVIAAVVVAGGALLLIGSKSPRARYSRMRRGRK